MKKSETASNLIEYIDAQIVTGAYPVGSKLPSLRAMARKFGISYSSAKKGIDYLEAQGKVRTVPRSGLYVHSSLEKAARNAGSRCIAIITPNGTSFDALNDNTPGLFHSALGTVRSLAAANGFELIILPLANIRVLDPTVVRTVNDDCCGVIIMKELDQWIGQLPFVVPTVGIQMENDYGGRISIVGLDPFNAARQAVSFFLARNLLRVHVVEFEAPSYRIRAQLFELFFREVGGMVTGRTVVRSGEVPSVEHYSADRGYWFSSDNMLYDCYKSRLEKAGENIIERYCVLGVDGKSLICPWPVRFPTIAVDWKEIGRVAFQECLAGINNPKHTPQRIYLPGILSNQS